MTTMSAMETIRVKVARHQEQGQGVLVLDLSAFDGSALPAFTAGAHVDLHLADGLVRQYSLAGNPDERSYYRLGILKDPNSRGGSIAAHAQLRAGAEVSISAPRNHFPLDMDAPHSILLGGGIGITPMIAMAYQLHKAGKSFELHYCARSRASAAFIDELGASAFADHVHLHFDDEADAQRLNLPSVLTGADKGSHLYVCGPAGFMDSVIAEAEGLGIAAANIHREYFQVQTDTGGQSFEVVAQKSGQRVQVAEGQSIIDALAGVGIAIPKSCEQGICGTCLCDVIAGTPDHRDVYLTDEEKADNDQILLCCSRSKSATLVLDI